jgi:phosphatidylserine/phosphatidylglycerophosphate/cardiolipin synthase-like enzyme
MIRKAATERGGARRAARRLGVVAALAIASLAACRPPTGASVAPSTAEAPSAAEAPSTIELVESPPVETTLDHADVPNAADVWVAMIDGARRTLDLAEFYASDAEPKDRAASKLTPVLEAIERAVARGVRVRLLADSVFAPKYPATLERLRRAGVALRILDFGARGGGVLHAKYFVVDERELFLGSQNFDWRALTHIQEIGVRVRSAALARALLDLLETDWALAGGGPAEARVRRAPPAPAAVTTSTGERVTLVASPKGWLADEASWDLPRLVALLDGAARAIDVQVLTYKTRERAGGPFPTLDDALRRAAARGVRVRLLVSDWSGKPGSEERRVLEALASVPNVEVRVLTIPRWSGGEIPFARVAHAKYLVVDPAERAPTAWIGTSNWEGDYFTRSRNVGVLVEGGKLAARLDGVFEDGWSGAYAAPLARPSAPPP